MRQNLRSSLLLSSIVFSIVNLTTGCGEGSSQSSQGSSTSSGSAGSGGEGGKGGAGGSAGQAGQGGSAGQAGQGGSAGQAGQGGAGGGSVECTAGETMTCYSGDPATSGVGTCKPGTLACINGQWDTKCMGEVLPSGAPEVCDGQDEDCNGQVDDGFGPTTCGMGVCQVTVNSCANGVPQTCTPGQPVPPKCDGFDEDCDGQIDELDEGCSCTTGAKQPCYSGMMGTDGIGACKKGVQTCENGAWGACTGEVLPTAETCNSLDDDCNGQVDDGLGQTSCGTGKCAVTVNNCVNGAQQQCIPSAPMLETCNNVDDNCNGAIDDGLGNISCGLGACRVTVAACNGGMQGMCVPGTPTAEVCDDSDNDCDGMVDEGNPGGGGTCNTQLPGACAVGTLNCSFGTMVCAITVQPTNETCNGIDDNCNGVVDDGNPGGGQACSTGLSGPCVTGVSFCSNGAIGCNQTVFPTTETCDNIDNNCNGSVDENNAGGGGTCTVAGQQGLCAAGTNTCSNGSLVCAQTVAPTAEICDNKDNDCDGMTDEGNPGGNQNCTAAAQLGECSKGKTTCTNGSFTCTPGMPAAELCDTKDNDCDGVIDDGNPGGGMSCTTAFPGICAAGTTACSNGAIVCNGNQAPKVETCNGLDDNCNGVVDDNAGSGQVCTAAGQIGQCAIGTTNCSGGTLSCIPGTPSVEVCDGKDNDCDNVTDENNPGGGQFCTAASAQGECRNGSTSCSGGSIVCVPSGASTEVCDGKDNDCDGAIDENNAGGGAGCTTGLLGICSAGTATCINGALSCIQNQMPAAVEICGNTFDDNCNGQVDENTDADGDGWGICNGDCCDNPATCSQPILVNPGAFEVLNNGVNDDCDAATSDTVAVTCEPAALATPTSAMNLVNAMDICQTTTAAAPLPTKKWGVLQASLLAADGTSTAPVDLQRGVLNNFGPNVTPRKGTRMAAISTGTARDATDPGFIQPETGWEASGLGNPPAVYLAAHGGTLQTTPGCTTANDANDSVNLRVQMRVPTNAQSFTYKFKFYTTEYPEWVCTQYNDFYLALLTSNVAGIPADRNISFDTLNNPVSVNVGFFDVCSVPAQCPAGTNELIGTGVGGPAGALDDGGGTVWLTTTSPIVPGETMTIEFMTWDTGDRIYDSTVLLDAFEWSVNAATVGTVPN